MGRRIQMSSLHRTIFLSADETKSRCCLELTLKVVVVIYVVKDKIVVILHYICHFFTRNIVIKWAKSYRYRIKNSWYNRNSSNKTMSLPKN